MLYTLKIKLAGSSKPPIWRKVQVDSKISFYELHAVIQGVFNWYNTHMFRFSHGKYTNPAIVFNYPDNP